MIAAHIVAVLLDGEDPKFALRQFPPMLRLPSMAEVEFGARATWENEDPAGHFCNDEDLAYVRAQIETGNVWGWCSVEVEAKFTTEDGEKVTASDFLGGCSYPSRAAFMEPGGAYDDMKAEAYDGLCAELEALGYE